MSTRLSWPVYVGFALFAGFGLWVILKPDQAWRGQRAFVGWQYRDGHRIELSPAGRLWTRFTGVIPLVVVLGITALTVDWSAESRVATEVAPGGDTVYYYLGDPVESPGCTVRVIACLRSDVVFPIEVTRYEAFGSVATGPDGLAGLDALPAGTNLLLQVADRFFPTHLVVSEQADRVTVSLYGKCASHLPGQAAAGRTAADCESYSPPLLSRIGVVPVSLDEPLGGRSLVDGNRGGPVERATA